MIFDPAFKRVRYLFRPQRLFPIVHLFIVRRKVHASTGVYKFDSIVIQQYVHKRVWTPLTDKSVRTSE